ncbi:MAG: S8 family serine peptidase, partial [Gammaproteobacteria bacterium]
MSIKSVAGMVAGILLGALLTSISTARGDVPASDVTSRLIIKVRAGTMAESGDQGHTGRAVTQSARRNATDRARQLAEIAGLPVRATRDLGRDMVAIALGAPLGGDALDETLAKLRANPEVEFTEVDQRRFARAVPSDPLYTSQWYLQGVETSATNFEAAWDVTTGDAGTVVAVLDTGVRFDHPDLAGRVLPGYDFVSGESASSFASANDGDDWDNDASDPGDWVSVSESNSGPLAGCDVGQSSWHGTRVAAIIGATTDNGTGVAGGTWTGSVLPVRVLGKCGGYDSDIVAGMRWAAGLPVSGVPANPNPAKVI